MLYRETGSTDQFNDDFHRGVELILDLWTVEQDHAQSPYLFERDTWRKEDTLTHKGKGSPVAPTGMTWSGFRPSDDACQYGYLIPSNMFAVVVLSYLEDLYNNLFHNESVATRAKQLKEAIQSGIADHALVQNSKGETIYAYEVDGLGQFSIMDDANIPSLLAAPYLGFALKMTLSIWQRAAPFSAKKTLIIIREMQQQASVLPIHQKIISGISPLPYKD